jgi:hypothetical protein
MCPRSVGRGGMRRGKAFELRSAHFFRSDLSHVPMWEDFEFLPYIFPQSGLKLNSSVVTDYTSYSAEIAVVVT